MLHIIDWIWAKFNRFPTNNSFAKKLSFVGSISNVRFTDNQTNLCYIHLFISTIARTFRKQLPEIRSKVFLAIIRKIPSTIFYVFFIKRIFLVTISNFLSKACYDKFQVLIRFPFFVSTFLNVCISAFPLWKLNPNVTIVAFICLPQRAPKFGTWSSPWVYFAYLYYSRCIFVLAKAQWMCLFDIVLCVYSFPRISFKC